jgi:hypothetical protein
MLFLPLDRASVDQLMLPLRIALEAVRQGRADLASIRILIQAVMLTGFVNRAGYGKLDQLLVEQAEQSLSNIVTQQRETGECNFSDSLILDVTCIVNEYDRQLSENRMQVFVHASEQLNRIIEKNISRIFG